MKRVNGLLLTATLALGAGCGAETIETSGPQRNPLALNVAIERSFTNKSFSDEFKAGLGIALANVCIEEVGLHTYGVEEVPDVLRDHDDYTRAVEMVQKNSFTQSAVKDKCNEIASKINKLV